MINITKELLDKLHEFRNKKGQGFGVEDIDTIINQFVSIFEKHASENDEHIFQELKRIGATITDTKKDIAANLDGAAVSEATEELDMVVIQTEQATDKILDATEEINKIIINLQDNKLKESLQNQVNNIVESCNFQDLTGQRIKKVMRTLKDIEVSVGELIDSFVKCYNYDSDKKIKDKRPDADLLNGPQALDSTPTQEDIDKLFNGS